MPTFKVVENPNGCYGEGEAYVFKAPSHPDGKRIVFLHKDRCWISCASVGLVLKAEAMQQSCFLKRGSLQVVGAGVELEDVGLFIDQNHSGLQKSAELKFGWGGELAELVSRVLYLAQIVSLQLHAMRCSCKLRAWHFSLKLRGCLEACLACNQCPPYWLLFSAGTRG